MLRRGPAAGWGGADRLRPSGHVARPAGGRRRRVWAFVMVLRCSRHMFVRPVLRMDQRAWTECHVEAFAFFGGVPGPAGAGQPEDRGGQGRTSTTRRSTARMPSSPSTTALLVDPARAGKPKDKPRVERPMPYVRDSFWRGREFASIEAHAAGRAVVWCAKVAGRRAVPAAGWRGTGGGVRRGRSRRAASRCRARRSCSPPGRPARSARTSTSRSARPCTRCRGGSSARRVDARATANDGADLPRRRAGRHPRRTPARASRPTLRTTRRRRSRSRCGPRPGAAAAPPRSARPAPR